MTTEGSMQVCWLSPCPINVSFSAEGSRVRRRQCERERGREGEERGARRTPSAVRARQLNREDGAKLKSGFVVAQCSWKMSPVVTTNRTGLYTRPGFIVWPWCRKWSYLRGERGITRKHLASSNLVSSMWVLWNIKVQTDTAEHFPSISVISKTVP